MAQEISRKFKRIFFVRALLLAVLALSSVIFSTLTLEQFLIKSALRSEAEYFWDKYQTNSNVSAPDTWNLSGYVFDEKNLNQVQIEEIRSFITPESSSDETGSKAIAAEGLLGKIDQGFTRLTSHPGYTLLYKTVHDDKQLLLVFDGTNVRSLAIFLGIIPLILFLLISYLLVWLFYRKAKEVLSPITWLASKFADFDPVSPNLPKIELNEMPKDADYEATVLAESLSEYVARIEKFIGRERAFTRDVSHELRTPLTVIKMATQVMESNGDLSATDQKTLDRIKGAGKDMLELVEVFLILARESDNQVEVESVDIAEVVEHELMQSSSIIDTKPVEVIVKQNSYLSVDGSVKILEVLVGNLIRNAFKYTEQGTVTIEINQDNICIIDTGIGMTENQVNQVFKPYFRAGHRPDGGHGIGLTIVKRISDRFDWPVNIQSEVNKGTKVTIDFS